MRAWIPLICAGLATAGCATHVPPNAFAEKRYLQIDWIEGFDEARAEALALDRPLLAVLVAGRLDGLC
ncbi:MAG TPA: hypothetical protein ENK18_17300 [Deltaproteobacteria bacterium]|nr:hypothetical protein [Deltaproteobacteria bacterium]